MVPRPRSLSPSMDNAKGSKAQVSGFAVTCSRRGDRTEQREQGRSAWVRRVADKAPEDPKATDKWLRSSEQVRVQQLHQFSMKRKKTCDEP